MGLRKALEVFAVDMRAAEDVTEATGDSVTIVYPDNDSFDGRVIRYDYDSDDSSFTRVSRDSDGNLVRKEELLGGVEKVAFAYFDPLGNRLDSSTASLLLSIKSVQLDAKMVRGSVGPDATDYIISARFMMRNRPVTN